MFKDLELEKQVLLDINKKIQEEKNKIKDLEQNNLKPSSDDIKRIRNLKNDYELQKKKVDELNRKTLRVSNTIFVSPTYAYVLYSKEKPFSSKYSFQDFVDEADSTVLKQNISLINILRKVTGIKEGIEITTTNFLDSMTRNNIFRNKPTQTAACLFNNVGWRRKIVSTTTTETADPTIPVTYLEALVFTQAQIIKSFLPSLTTGTEELKSVLKVKGVDLRRNFSSINPYYNKALGIVPTNSFQFYFILTSMMISKGLTSEEKIRNNIEWVRYKASELDLLVSIEFCIKQALSVFENTQFPNKILRFDNSFVNLWKRISPSEPTYSYTETVDFLVEYWNKKGLTIHKRMMANIGVMGYNETMDGWLNPDLSSLFKNNDQSEEKYFSNNGYYNYFIELYGKKDARKIVDLLLWCKGSPVSDYSFPNSNFFSVYQYNRFFKKITTEKTQPRKSILIDFSEEPDQSSQQNTVIGLI